MAKKNGKPGPAPFEFTEEIIRQVEHMAGCGLRQDEIALVLGIGTRTLERRKAEEEAVSAAIARGRAEAKRDVGSALLKKALTGDVKAIRWWETTRIGYAGRVALEHSGTLDVKVTRKIVGAKAVRNRLAKVNGNGQA